MNEPPSLLDGAEVVAFAIVDDRVTPTGGTKHWKAGTLLGPAPALAIARYDKATDEFYLFYCDKEWQVITDTCHPTLELARHQAEFEYLPVLEHSLTAASRLSVVTSHFR